MRKWLRETHGSQFELLRHFVKRLFDSEMVTSPEQTKSALIGAVSLFLPWFQVFFGPLKAKYAHLSSLPAPGPYREALRADELWLLTLMMSIVGLLTAIKWQSLFPDLSDYRALAALPLRPRQIFLAKLTALLLVAAAALAAVNWLPSSAFPALTNSHWAFQPSLGPRIRAYALASTAGGAFLFFAQIALQGVLLNILRPRAFHRVTGYLQGLLVGCMLGLIVLSFSIQPAIADTLVQPRWSRWLPPLWFLGLCQSQSGDPDPAMRWLAHRAVIGLLAAVGLALFTYALSYRRHRELLAGCSFRRAKNRRWGVLAEWLFPDPRQQGVVSFLMRTLARSNHHRMIVMGYGGLAFAVLLSGFTGMSAFVGPDRVAAADFVFFHLVAILFVLVGARHLFSLPAELKANWLFRITEREARGQWLPAVDRLVFSWAALLWIAPLPAEIRWLGWRGLAEAALSAVLGLAAYEWFFGSWNKLPFTCSHLPGKTPGWMLALQFFAVLALAPLLQSLLLAALYIPLAYAASLAAAIVAWTRIHAVRTEAWPELLLKFDERPEPAVESLNLLR